MTRADCDRTRELLPWYALGTLAREEREAVTAHLSSCAGCPAELADTRRALWITSRHLPSGLLADYACGLELGDWPRELVEDHLAGCAACREDLALDESAALAPLPGRRRGASAGWRPLALAASLVAAVGLGWLGGRLVPAPADSPSAGPVSLVELEPRSRRLRDTAAEIPAAVAATPVTVVLHSDLIPDGVPHRLRVYSSRDELLQESAGLTPTDAGGFVVLLDARGWSPGELRLELEAAASDGWRPFESYRLRLEP